VQETVSIPRTRGRLTACGKSAMLAKDGLHGIEPKGHTGRTMKRLLRPRTVVLGVILALLAAGLAVAVGLAQTYGGVVDTYWRVHDEVLMPTEAGRRYIDLFWRHNGELCQLVVANERLTLEGQAVILQFEPALRALVDGDGGEVIVTRPMVERAEAYLDLLVEVGSPELQETIRAERERTPLDGLIGMTFEEARVILVGQPETAIPTQASTAVPQLISD